MKCPDMLIIKMVDGKPRMVISGDFAFYFYDTVGLSVSALVERINEWWSRCDMNTKKGVVNYVVRRNNGY